MDYDLIFVGGGLASGLAASLLRLEQAGIRLLVLDAGRPADWDQTWSFQILKGRSDGTRTGVFRAPQQSWLAPFLTQVWDSYEVRFPDLHRVLETPYASIRYQTFVVALRQQLGSAYREGVKVETLEPQRVVLADGSVLSAKCVIDSRGWPSQAAKPNAAEGYQKFLGQHLRLGQNHGLERPLMMDATVPQEDGFRFLYVLPWNARELLIEDTHYSRTAWFDRQHYREEIAGYAQKNAWNIEAILGEEEGSLPIPCFGGLPAAASPLAQLGVRGGFFHPTTGYSIFEAVRVAEWLAEQRHWEASAIRDGLARLSSQRWKDMEFYRRLNNMMFFAAEDEQRYRVLERFYEHDEDLVARFYAGRIHGRDKLKILSGRPPVPVKKGLYHFFHKAGVAHGPA